MKNNLSPKLRDLAKTNLVYEYKCQRDASMHLPPSQTKYVGLTTCQLTRRMSYHLQSGAIKKHSEIYHNKKVTREEIEMWTNIRFLERDNDRLSILESLIIHHEDPALNRQDTGKCRIMKLYRNQ